MVWFTTKVCTCPRRASATTSSCAPAAADAGGVDRGRGRDRPARLAARPEESQHLGVAPDEGGTARRETHGDGIVHGLELPPGPQRLGVADPAGPQRGGRTDRRRAPAGYLDDHRSRPATAVARRHRACPSSARDGMTPSRAAAAPVSPSWPGPAPEQGRAEALGERRRRACRRGRRRPSGEGLLAPRRRRVRPRTPEGTNTSSRNSGRRRHRRWRHRRRRGTGRPRASARVARATRRAAGTGAVPRLRRRPAWRRAPRRRRPRRSPSHRRSRARGASVGRHDQRHCGVPGGERVPGAEKRLHAGMRRAAGQRAADVVGRARARGQKGVARSFGEGRAGGAPPQTRHRRRAGHPAARNAGVGGLPRQGQGVLVGSAHRHRTPCRRRSPTPRPTSAGQPRRRGGHAAPTPTDCRTGSSVLRHGPVDFHAGPAGVRPAERAVPTKLRWISTVPAPMHKPRTSR